MAHRIKTAYPKPNSSSRLLSFSAVLDCGRASLNCQLESGTKLLLWGWPSPSFNTAMRGAAVSLSLAAFGGCSEHRGFQSKTRWHPVALSIETPEISSGMWLLQLTTKRNYRKETSGFSSRVQRLLKDRTGLTSLCATLRRLCVQKTQTQLSLL